MPLRSSCPYARASSAGAKAKSRPWLAARNRLSQSSSIRHFGAYSPEWFPIELRRVALLRHFPRLFEEIREAARSLPSTLLELPALSRTRDG
jgi:hypothetical protein